MGWRAPCAVAALPSAEPPPLLAGSGGAKARSGAPIVGSGTPAAARLPSLVAAAGFPSSFGLAAGAPSSLSFGGLAAATRTPSSYPTAPPLMAATPTTGSSPDLAVVG
ncbi:hypothetical protein GUJ93_ZPchr0011g28712 [Zizania palustris]|uniref:Uncharacterized protein n=1 Tax=Zizania palustris TaxID=103762 RepID=A0A8J6BU07_ZIZPA|nr:hypothetical protein GUJ93_ZPchr0011g28712 [Zizania palustris]